MGKICVRCRDEKPFDNYWSYSKSRDGLQYQCKGCRREQRKNESPRARDRARLQAQSYRYRNQERVANVLRTASCVDCGESDIVVLDFDHLPGSEKVDCIARMINNGYSWGSIQAEIAKCEVRCANCHRRRTARERGYFRAQAVNDETNGEGKWTTQRKISNPSSGSLPTSRRRSAANR